MNEKTPHRQTQEQANAPLVCVFAVGTRARHPPLLLPWLAGQLQREGLVHLQGGLARRGC